jgi:hypothetical protein
MVIFRGPQFSQVHGSSDVFKTAMEHRTQPSLVHLHRLLASKSARIDRKTAAEMLALTLRPSIPAASRLGPTAVI